jgi:thiol-disulfide isomerase/thioredoxin
MTKKLDILTNIAIVIVALIASAVLVKNYLLSKPEQGVPLQIAVGEKLSLTDVDWKGNRNTLVLALTPGCDSCSESAPFYRRLSAELPVQRVHLTAVLPASVEESREYLRSLKVEIGDVRQGSFQSLKVEGTPTLILVDEEGVVRNVWLGRFPPDKEQQVIDIIREAVS